MPSKPNSISSLRGRFDPHYKLSGKVEGLEKGVSDQVSQIHKTISKSFVTQRKTLARVLGLEKREIYILKLDYFNIFVEEFKQGNLYSDSTGFISKRLKQTEV